MREPFNRLIGLPATQFDDDAAAQGRGWQFAADHANGLWTERLEQSRCEVRLDAPYDTLAAGMAGIDDAAQRALVIAGEHRIELVDHEARLPKLDRAVQRRLADLDRRHAAWHQKRDQP
jgi:hypothetical protein